MPFVVQIGITDHRIGVPPGTNSLDMIGTMANGTKGDHPLTDILNWNIEVFGQEGDDLVRQIVQLGGKDYLHRDPTNLVALDPRYFPNVNIEAVTHDLRDLRDRLHSDAIERGWDVR